MQRQVEKTRFAGPSRRWGKDGVGLFPACPGGVYDVLAVVSDWVWEADGGNILTYSNSRVYDRLGYRADEVVGKDFLELVSLEDHDAALAHLAAARISTHAAVRTMVHRDGHPVIIDLTIVPLNGDGGACPGYRGVGRGDDRSEVVEEELRTVSEEREGALEELRAIEEELRQQYQELQQKEETLRESERRFRSVLEQMELLAVVLDRDNRVVFCNDRLLKTTGWEREDIVGRDFFSLLPEDIRTETRTMLLSGLAGGGVIPQLAFEVNSREDMRRLVKWNNTLLFDHRNQPSGIALVGEDITNLSPKEEVFDILSDYSPIGIFIIQGGKFKFCNQQTLACIGCGPGEMLGKDFHRFVHPEDIGIVRQNARKILKGGVSAPYEYRGVTVNGEIRWILEMVAPIQYLGRPAALGCFIDITDRKLAHEAIRASETRYRAIFESTGTAMSIVEADTTLSMINTEFERLTGYSKEEVENKKSWTVLPVPEDLERMRNYHRQRRDDPGSAPKSYEFRLLTREGAIRHVILNIDMIPGTTRSVASIIDITARKEAEEQLHYLSSRDLLTGLHNRNYFETEMKRLSGSGEQETGLIICDIDGLKMVNDTFGHETGNRLLVAAAGLIRERFRPGDVIARIGGDEFAILVQAAGKTVVEGLCHRVREAIDDYNRENPALPLSISLGFSVTGLPPRDMNALFKEADDNMYREKLHRSLSTRSYMVQTLMKALEARDFITEGHAERLQDLVVSLGAAVGLPDQNVADLKLLAQFHDIGKVGVPDSILFKPGALTEAEYREMQRHCEIGQRISLSSPDLTPIADWVLKHHEWWNGRGYPLGLKGEEIPLECRILAIADAFDAMTSDRPYRKAATCADALAELVRCAGSQFDPRLVAEFLKLFEG